LNTLSQQEFEALFDHAAIGIITINPGGEIVMVNQFALQQFGYTRGELIGHQIETLVPARQRAVHQQHRNGYQGNSPHSRPMGNGLSLCGLRKDKTEFPVEISISVYHTAEGRFSIAFINDITVRNASERALVQLNTELEEKVALRTRSLQEALEKAKDLSELKSRFVTTASHEFRTPLSTILSSAYLVSQYPEKEDFAKREKHIQRIISSVNMLTDTLNDFLSVGKIEEGKVHVRALPVMLPEWMDLMVDELSTLLKKGQRLRYNHQGPPDVVLDPSLLTHIVQNLVSNAVKFSPEGAAIILSTTRGPQTLTLAVTDTGIGIPEADQKHLFERFFRGGNAANIQGSGLGLHIVGKYAEMMNGQVAYQSSTEQGSTFTVTFHLENPVLS
jgi:PAS domain S-box-containing protein